MADSPSRRYGDADVSRIFERAAELQATQRELPAESADGMSLAELEQVAREAGIDPALVRRAAGELDVPRPPAPNPLLGAPTRLVLERVVPREITPEEYPGLVAVIQQEMGDLGQPSSFGRALAWHSSPPVVYGRRAHGRQVAVSVTPRDGRTVIRVEEALGSVAGGLFGGLVGGLGGAGVGMGVGIGIGALHAPLVALGIAGGALAGSYLLARGIYGMVARRRGGRLEGLAERLAEAASRE